MIERVILDALLTLFAVMLAIAIASPDDAGDQPDTPNFILVAVSFDGSMSGSLPTLTNSDNQPVTPSLPPYLAISGSPRFGFVLFAPLLPGDYGLSYQTPLPTTLAISTRDGLPITRPVPKISLK